MAAFWCLPRKWGGITERNGGRWITRRLQAGRFRGAVTLQVSSLFHRFRFSAAALAALVLLPGCTLPHLLPWQKKPPRAIAKISPFVGTVTLVSEDPSFVLIDNGSLPPPAAGTALIINTPGIAPVEMKVTAIRKPPFVVADIVKGIPKKGDRVFEVPQ